MKKIIISIFLLILGLCIVGCTTPIKEYNGKKIVKLTYTTIEYHGGYTNTKIINFEENKYYSAGYLSNENDLEFELKNTFSDDEEKVFIDGCFVSGLFNLEELYKQEGIIDGGEWNLVIEYEDGTNKTSKGINKSPSKVFNKCAPYFYDLCKEEVLGTLPQNYTNPPQLSYSFDYKKENTSVSTNEIAKVQRANYKWNKGEFLDNNIFLINEDIKKYNEFSTDYDYRFILYTSNYRYDKKFSKLIVKQYDYNIDLTNENIMYDGSWFKQIGLELKFNKIYVYELYYDNGDYVQYTFNTYCEK